MDLVYLWERNFKTACRFREGMKKQLAKWPNSSQGIAVILCWGVAACLILILKRKLPMAPLWPLGECLYPVVLYTSIFAPIFSPSRCESPVQLCVFCMPSWNSSHFSHFSFHLLFDSSVANCFFSQLSRMLPTLSCIYYKRYVGKCWIRTRTHLNFSLRPGSESSRNEIDNNK